MKRLKRPTLLVLAAVLSGMTFLGLSCGKNAGDIKTTSLAVLTKPVSAVDTACASALFNLGRPVKIAELQSYDQSKFSLESISFRDVIYGAGDQVEIAYRTEMKMRLSPDRFLVPEHNVACHEENHPSKHALLLSRTMIPVIGDLHLPSTRITIFDQSRAGGSEDQDRLYNYPRISEISVSAGGYFSFNQNWAPYRKVQTLDQYMEILRSRSLYTRVEVREMGYGRLAIYAEKDVAGERTQLLISLVEGSE